MYFSTLLFLALGGAGALAGRSFDAAFAPLEKRALKSCAETYGPSSQQCGQKDSGFCFNPAVGQTCCTSDFGYCNKGSYCAPVPGFCCSDDQTVEECAEEVGFEIPPTGTIVRTATATAGLAGPTSGAASGSSPTRPATVPGKNSTGPSVVTVASSNQLDRSLALSVFMAVLGLLASSW